MNSLHLIISGRVQGVAFRAHTQKKAIEMGITGWVKNLPDGSVEVMSYGPKNILEKFLAWCHQGPPAARVNEVISEWELNQNPDEGFLIK
ncbi:MAG: Acylphosphatase [uncultured bacterium]|nr:MAG: Acylphosphatase [uncultured bacterium]